MTSRIHHRPLASAIGAVRTVGSALLAATLLAAPVGAQTVGGARFGAPPRALEGFLTQYRFAAGDAPVAVEGVGGRFVWTTPPVLGDPTSLAARTSLGVFGVFLPRQNGLGYTTLHAGGELSVRPLPAPVAARVEPVVSLGVGALRTDVADRVRVGTRDLALGDRADMSLALSPGVGARVALVPGLDLRADVRDVITFREAVRNNLAYGVGLGMAF
jgi:hypothetical protein